MSSMTHAEGGGRPFGELSDDHPIHDGVFGNRHEEAADDTPPGADHDSVNIIGAPAQPERNQPMRSLGHSDHGDRQPDGGRRR